MYISFALICRPSRGTVGEEKKGRKKSGEDLRGEALIEEIPCGGPRRRSEI